MNAPRHALPSRARGAAALALAGFLFGATFLVVGDALERIDVLPFLSLRFAVASAVLVPIARRRAGTPGEFRHGVIAGLSLFVGYLLQTAGLRTVDPATSAFITYLLIVIVPLLTAARARRMPDRTVGAALLLAIAGLWALSGGPASFGRGELLTLLAAFGFAVHIVVVGEVSGRHDPVRLTLWQLVTVCVCSTAGTVATGGFGTVDGQVMGAVLFCGIGATAVAFWCMTWAQRVVPGPQAALILLLEPVSAALLGQLFGHPLGLWGAVGALLILVSVVIAEFGGRRLRSLGAEIAIVNDPG